MFIKFQSIHNPTKNLKEDDVVFFQNVYRKISGNMDILCQLYIKDKSQQHNIQVIGRIDRHNYVYSQEKCHQSTIVDVPTTAIIRSKINLEVSIIDINLARVKYICQICGNPLDVNAK